MNNCKILTNQDIELINSSKINSVITLSNGIKVKIKKDNFNHPICEDCYIKETHNCHRINCSSDERGLNGIYVQECKNK